MRQHSLTPDRAITPDNELSTGGRIPGAQIHGTQIPEAQTPGGWLPSDHGAGDHSGNDHGGNADRLDSGQPIDRRNPSDRAARFLVVLDVDSTLIENEVIELLAADVGSLAEVAEITERAMNGELDFEQSLRTRVATLKGLSVARLPQIARGIRVTPGVTRLIEALHANNSVVGVVSGGFHELLDPLARQLGLDFWRANRLEAIDGVLTGEVSGPVIDAKAKASALREWATAYGVPVSQTVAVGDGANDLEMMSAAGLSVAFDARPLVRAHAKVALNARDLSQLLPALGLDR